MKLHLFLLSAFTLWIHAAPGELNILPCEGAEGESSDTCILDEGE